MRKSDVSPDNPTTVMAVINGPGGVRNDKWIVGADVDFESVRLFALDGIIHALEFYQDGILERWMVRQDVYDAAMRHLQSLDEAGGLTADARMNAMRDLIHGTGSS